MSEPTTLRERLEAIRDITASNPRPLVRSLNEHAVAALDLLDADDERYFNLLSEHGTDEVFAFIYDPKAAS